MTIFEVILSDSIMCNCSAMSELEDEFDGSADTHLNSIYPFSLIEWLFVTQIVSSVLSSANDNFYCAIIECRCSSAAVIHNNHLLVEVGVFNDNGWGYGVEIRWSRLSCSRVISLLIDIWFPSHKLKSIGIGIEQVICRLDVQTVEVHCNIHAWDELLDALKVKVEFNFIQGDVPAWKSRSWESNLQESVLILVHIAFELHDKHLFVLSLVCNNRCNRMIPRYRLILRSLKYVEPFIMICIFISAVVSIIVSEIDGDSSLSALISLVDSEVEQAVLKSIGVVEQVEGDVLVEQGQIRGWAIHCDINSEVFGDAEEHSWEGWYLAIYEYFTFIFIGRINVWA